MNSENWHGELALYKKDCVNEEKDKMALIHYSAHESEFVIHVPKQYKIIEIKCEEEELNDSNNDTYALVRREE